MTNLIQGTRFALLLAFAMLVVPPGHAASVGDQLTEMGIRTGQAIVTDPGDFLFDIHLNNQDRAPLPVGKIGQVGLNLFPNLLPWTEAGLSLKGRALREHGGLPQVDIIGGAWKSILSMAVKSDSFASSLWGGHAGFTVSESLHPRLRLFGGYEYTWMRADIDIKDDTSGTSAATSTGDFDFMEELKKNDISVVKAEHFLFAGAELLRTPKHRLVSEMGYGVMTRKLIIKVTWASRSFDTGFSFYPEGAWTLWPFMNFQVRF